MKIDKLSKKEICGAWEEYLYGTCTVLVLVCEGTLQWPHISTVHLHRNIFRIFILDECIETPHFGLCLGNRDFEVDQTIFGFHSRGGADGMMRYKCTTGVRA